MDPLPTGVSMDVAGGPVAAITQNWGTLNDIPIIVVPDPVMPHGDAPHDAAFMAAGSPWMTINDLPVCRLGDPATCGDLLAASQDWFRIS